LETEIPISFFLEKSNVSLPAVFVSVIPIPCDSLMADTPNLGYFDRRVVAWRLLVMTDEVVPGRNKEIANLELDANHSGTLLRTGSSVKLNSEPDGKGAVVCDKRRTAIS
jgi:hypothetical protein